MWVAISQLGKPRCLLAQQWCWSFFQIGSLTLKALFMFQNTRESKLMLNYVICRAINWTRGKKKSWSGYFVPVCTDNTQYLNGAKTHYCLGERERETTVTGSQFSLLKNFILRRHTFYTNPSSCLHTVMLQYTRDSLTSWDTSAIHALYISPVSPTQSNWKRLRDSVLKNKPHHNGKSN